jgi:hypothetical protein
MGEIVTLTAHPDVPMHVDPAGHGFIATSSSSGTSDRRAAHAE